MAYKIRLFLLVGYVLHLLLFLGNLELILAKLTVSDVKLFVIIAFVCFSNLFLFFIIGLVLKKFMLQSLIQIDQDLLILGLLTINFKKQFY